MHSDIKIGLYRHYKGNVYRVIAVGKHSETLEDMVIYQGVKNGEYWVRPAQMWNEDVCVNGETLKRFSPIEHE